MIYVKYNNENEFIKVSFKRISPNVVSLEGSITVNQNGFCTYKSDGTKLGDFSDYKTVCRTVNHNETWYSNDGSIYKEPEKFIPREPTADEIKQMLIDGVQNYMDEVAMTRGYDGILSACSYIDTGVERFDIEGEQARKWRSQVWAYCYAYLDEVLAGNREIPTLDALIQELPKIDWITE